MAQTTVASVSTKLREDLLDVITNISPVATPMLSTMAKKEANNTTHSWLTDVLAAAALNNKAEGYTPNPAAGANPTKIDNYCQLVINEIEVTGTVNAVKKVAGDDEYVYQMTKRMKEHARDIEYAIVNNAATAASASSPRVMKNMRTAGMFDAANDVAAGAAFDETEFNTAIANAWDDGGEPDTVLVDSTDKRTITGFTASVTRTVDAGERRQISRVDIYESDFGIVRVIPHRNLVASVVYVLEVGRWALAFLRTTREEKLAKIADSERGWILSEVTLESLAPSANAFLTGTF